ncbi:MAG: gamma-glutamyltransferase [Bacteroidales bacterium]|nr:gamma-glutamyltransferase [Bacteroidales bacterium]
MKHIFTLTLSLLLIVRVSFAQDRISSSNMEKRSEVIAPHGMVCTSQPLATQIALDILKKGGTAVDAAIAADAALGLMEPTGSGMGGDLFAIVWDAKTQKLYGINSSGPSPKSLTLKWFKDHGYKYIPGHGPLPVSVPGCVDGWNELHKRFGKLPVSEILEPTIQYAREGYPVSELIAFYWNLNARILKKYPGFADIFMPDGKAPVKGQMFKNPALANTLELLSKKGLREFYEGKPAHVIDQYMKENGGFLSYDDLASYHAEWVQPLSTNYRGYDVWELPPNGQGIAALQMLNMLENFDIKKMGFGSAEYMHLFTEVKKLAYEDRAKFYADPRFVKIPIKWLISKEYAKERLKLYNPEKAATYYPSGQADKGETIYLTVADQYGNMVSFIQSNYRGMGSGMTPTGLGFVLQDRGELFSLTDGQNNTYEPGKRPFHTIIPAFVTKDGKPYMSFGVMGGAMQPQGHVQILVNMIDFGMNLQEAGDAPRMRHDGSSQPTGEKMQGSGWLNLESGFSYDTIRKLMLMGHKIRFSLGGYGGYQAILWDDKNKVYYGASESRKDGQAAGY